MPQKQPVRIRAQKIITTAMGLVAIIISTLITAELTARGYYFIETRRLVSAAEMYAYQPNGFVADLTKEECRYSTRCIRTPIWRMSTAPILVVGFGVISWAYSAATTRWSAIRRLSRSCS
jgi:hypothetical protein